MNELEAEIESSIYKAPLEYEIFVRRNLPYTKLSWSKLSETSIGSKPLISPNLRPVSSSNFRTVT